MILVCICKIDNPLGGKVHEYGGMLWLQDRKDLGNPGFNPEFWRLATELESQIYYHGVRNLLTAIEKSGL